MGGFISCTFADKFGQTLISETEKLQETKQSLISGDDTNGKRSGLKPFPEDFPRNDILKKLLV